MLTWCLRQVLKKRREVILRSVELQQSLSLATQSPFPRSRTLRETKQDGRVKKKERKVRALNGILKRTESVLVLYLLLGDVSLNKLLQNPTVVDVCITTSTQRPVSLSVTKHKSRLKVVSNMKYIHTVLTSRAYFMSYDTHLCLILEHWCH